MEISKLLNSCSIETSANQGSDKDSDVNAFTELLSSLLGNMVLPNQPPLQPQDKSSAMEVNASTLEATSQVMQNQTKLLQELLINNSQGNIQKGTNINSPEIQNLLDNFEELLTSKTALPDEIVKFIHTLKVPDFEISKQAVSPSANNLDSIIGIGDKGNQEMQFAANKAPLDELLKVAQVSSGKFLEASIITGTPGVISSGIDGQSLENINSENSLSKESKGIISSLFNVVNPATVETERALNGVNTIDKLGEKSGNMSQKDTDVVSDSEMLKSLNSNEHLDKSFSKTLETAQTQLNKETILIEKQQDIIDISVEKFKTLRLPGLTEVTVKFKPEELGEISLKLVLEKGQISGNIAADKKEVVNLLQANLEQLKTDLKTNNVNFSNITVNLFAGDTFNQNPQRRDNGNHTNKANTKNLKQSFEEEVNEIEAFDGLDIIV